MGLFGPLGAHPRLFIVAYGLSFLFLAGAVGLFPQDFDRKKSLLLLFTLGLLLRLPFLLDWPVNSDAYRYLVEGFLQTRGVNPYRVAPGDPSLAHLAVGTMRGVFQGVNHKDLSACYPPLAELVFRGVAHVSPTPGMLKAVFLFFDLGTAAFLAGLLKKRGLPVSRLGLYILNPLVLVFISGEAHLDVMQAFFAAAALYFFETGGERRGFFALGAAVAVKYLALVLIPFFLSGRNLKKSLWFLVPLAAFLPFLDAGGALFASLGTFGAHMTFNASVTEAMRFLFGAAWLIPTLVLLGACLLFAWLFAAGRVRGAFLAVGATLLFLPSLYPWYLVLLSLFLPLFPSLPWLYLHAAMAFYFPVMAVEYAARVFQVWPGMALWEYVPFYVLLLYGLYRPGRLFPAERHAPVKTLSVVVPTLNEAGMIGACLDSIAASVNAGPTPEVIVADGGSADETVALAHALGAKTVAADKGRGGQIRAGIEAASGDVVLVLHADCRLAHGTPGRILRALTACPEALGGAAGMRFVEGSPGTRVISFLNAARLRLTGISFGDQGQFFRREALMSRGGFPGAMLMEDVEASFLLKEAGGVALSGGVFASDRTWRRRGFAGNFSRIALHFFRYLAVRRLGIADPTGRTYYQTYYRKETG
jgi:hypothetical protein